MPIEEELNWERCLSYLKDPPNILAKNEAIDRLASVMNSEDAVQVLVKVIENDDLESKYRAARSLCKLPTSSAKVMLLRFLSNGSSDVKKAILMTLREQPTLPESFADELIDTLSNPDLEIRSLAANALGRTKNPKATAALVGILKSDEEENVTLNALYGLALLRDVNAVSTIVKLLEDKSPRVREYAVVALASIGDEQAVTELIKKLQDKNETVRYQAARALGNMKAREALHALEKAANAGDFDFVHRMIQEAIELIKRD